MNLAPRFIIIEEGAFASCSSLETITIPASVERIGHCAFAMSCMSLYQLTFSQTNRGSRLTHIGDRAFSCCSSLTTVELPSKVQFIGKSAYELCHMISTVQIRFCERLQHVEEFTFAWCKQPTNLHLPNALQRSIGQPLRDAQAWRRWNERLDFNRLAVRPFAIPDCEPSEFLRPGRPLERLRVNIAINLAKSSFKMD